MVDAITLLQGNKLLCELKPTQWTSQSTRSYLAGLSHPSSQPKNLLQSALAESIHKGKTSYSC